MKITINNLNDVYKSKQCDPTTMELRGYEWITNLFVDSSGLGAEDEPALTQPQFKTELLKLINDNGGSIYTAITGAGQFQVNLGVYRKATKSKLKRISGNLYERTEDNKTIIRLYDTDIVTIDHNYGKMILNSGGFETVTTKKWINKYLPSHWMLKQQAFEWLLVDSRDGSITKFVDGIVIAC